MCIESLKLWSNPLYDKSDFYKDISEYGELGICCVVDPDERTDGARCCNFSRADSSYLELLGQGYENEDDEFDEDDEYREIKIDMKNVLRTIRTVLLVQAAIFIIYGALVLVMPEDVAYKLELYGKSREHERKVQVAREKMLIEEQKKLMEEERQHRNVLLDAFRDAVNKIEWPLGSENEDDKLRIDNINARKTATELVNGAKFDSVKNWDQLVALKQEEDREDQTDLIVTTSFARMYGAQTIAMGLICWLIRAHSLAELQTSSMFMIAWNGANLVGLVFAAIGRTGSNESSLAMIILIFSYGFATFGWVSLRDQIRNALARLHMKRALSSVKNEDKDEDGKLDAEAFVLEQSALKDSQFYNNN